MAEEKNLKTEDYVNEDDHGQVFFAWQVPEYMTHERSSLWYIGIIVISLALIIYSIFTANFLFALIVILVAFIIFLKSYYSPANLNFQITEEGILLGNQFFPYERIKNFYIIYKPPRVKKIFFNLKSFGPDLSIIIHDVNPLLIREKLLQYLEEDLEKDRQSLEDLMETLLKL